MMRRAGSVVRQARGWPGVASSGGLLLLPLLLACPLTLPAQERVTTWSTTTTVERVLSAADSAYARAVQLVGVGLGAEGRALMDSMVAATRPGSATTADALFWRATIAATTGAAERDYRVVTVEYALSPRAPEAMLRLAQLELARGDRPAALRYLERIGREHARSATRPRAEYWAGRVHLEAADSTRACASFASARAAARGEDGALRSQLDEYAGLCGGRGAVTQRGAPPASVEPVVSAAAAPIAAPIAAPPITAASIEAAFGGVAMPVSAPPPRDSARGGPPAGKITPPPAPERDRSTATGTGTPPPIVVTQPVAIPPALTTGWAVQIAAYDTESAARALAARLTSRGMPTIVRGAVAPYRVRVGPYTTRAAAVAAAARLRTAGQAANAFVVADTAQAGVAAP